MTDIAGLIDKLKTTDWSDIGAVSILKERIREVERLIRETIEKCAKICDPIEGEHFPPSWDATVIERHHATRRWCAAAIRALAQTDEASAPAPSAPQDDPAAGHTPPSVR